MVARLAVHRMVPLRTPLQLTVASLIVLPMPQQPMVEANTEAGSIINQ